MIEKTVSSSRGIYPAAGSPHGAPVIYAVPRIPVETRHVLGPQEDVQLGDGGRFLAGRQRQFSEASLGRPYWVVSYAVAGHHRAKAVNSSCDCGRVGLGGCIGVQANDVLRVSRARFVVTSQPLNGIRSCWTRSNNAGVGVE